MTSIACDTAECIDGPSNLTAEATAQCVAPPKDIPQEPSIHSASAELLEDGTLVLTWSSLGLSCGTRAHDVPFPEDCDTTGWAITAEIPAELVEVGVIDLASHGEVRGSITALAGGDAGAAGSYGSEPFLAGSIELLNIDESCISGVLHGFGTGSPDPTLGGPELNGSFIAPRC
ncbi:MAG: hypothetical protein JKY37_25655 [Nannocystaceae bacterium]|nr:hypothetical protein [Nannocystaceae bacterium]